MAIQQAYRIAHAARAGIPPRVSEILRSTLLMRNTLSVQQAFGTVVWVVCGVGVLAGVAGLFFSRKTWEEYGKHHL